MKWNLYELDIPSYVTCEYMTLILASISIIMVAVFMFFALKGHTIVSKTSIKGLLNKLAYTLDQRHMYGYIVTLRILSLLTLPICVWLITDNFDQWYYLEDTTIWHSSCFGYLDMVPYAVFHLVLVCISIWDKKRPAIEAEYKPVPCRIEDGYNAERISDGVYVYPYLKNNIVPFKSKE
jgi:hypothetical protein